MPIETIFLFLITDLMFTLTPGPATMVTVSHALPPGDKGGVRGALGPITGINIGNLIWYLLTALGLIALIKTVPIAYAALRWLGVAYLLWMSYRMYSGASAQLAGQQGREAGFRQGVVNGLAVHMSNPKALAFYTLIIPPFINPALSLPLQFLTLATLTLFTETSVQLFYAWLASKARNLGSADRSQAQFRKLAAGILVLAALILAWWNLQDIAISPLVNDATGSLPR